MNECEPAVAWVAPWTEVFQVVPGPMRLDICRAIEGLRLLRLEYGAAAEARFVEPHACGLSHRGAELLFARQTSGPSVSREPIGWKYFQLSRVRALAVTEELFAGPHPGYARDRVRLREIFCQL